MLKMAKWGPVLTGRNLGKIVRNEIEAKICSSNTPIIIDFEGIRIASHSFCDEFFGILVLNNEEIIKQIKFINTNETIKRIIKYVMLERMQEKMEAAGQQTITV
ncbi:MAG: hypothetical protein XD50_1363 [Clostridia bacterium 41_269]|nr:MAG: hypothetical protein XD50_1363 [Clostridia bacterium 41_269]